MVEVPADKPVTIPVLPIVTIAVFEDDHVPPEVKSVSVIMFPAHKEGDPVTEPALGKGLTVTAVVNRLPDIV